MNFLTVRMLICHVIVTSHGREMFEEPRCSKYDFEEKILEKVVRFELALESAQTKFDVLAEELRKQQAGLTEDRNQLLQEFQSVKDDVVSDVQKLKENVTTDVTALRTAREEDRNQLLQEFQSVKDDVVSEVHKLKENVTTDVTALRTAREEDRNQLLQEFQSVKDDVVSDVQKLKENVTTDVTALRTAREEDRNQLLQEFQSVKDDVFSDVQKLKENVTNDVTALRTAQERNQATAESQFKNLLQKAHGQIARISLGAQEIMNKTGPVSAFTVKVPTSAPNTHGISAVVRFTTIVYDASDDYDVTTGVFTCRHAGVYFFAFSLLRYITGGSYGYIYKGSEQLVIAVVNPSNGGYHGTSNFVTTHLVPGDAVFVGGATAGLTDMHDFSTFSGFLVTAG